MLITTPTLAKTINSVMVRPGLKNPFVVASKKKAKPC